MSFLGTIEVALGQNLSVYSSYGTGAPLIRMMDPINRDVSFIPRCFSIGYRVEVNERWWVGPEVFHHKDQLSPASYSPIITIMPVEFSGYVPANHLGMLLNADRIVRDGRFTLSGGGGLGVSILSLYSSFYLMFPLQLNAKLSYKATKSLSIFVAPKHLSYLCLNVHEWVYFFPFHQGFYAESGIALSFPGRP